MNKFPSIVGVLAVVVGVIGPADGLFAEVVSVDFNAPLQPGAASGTYSGTAVAPDLGTFWNGWLVPGSATWPGNVPNNSSSGVLNNSLGAATSTAFGTSVAVTLVSGWSAIDWGYNGLANWAPALMDDGLYTFASGSATAPVFTISGLAPGGTYNLYLYSENGSHYTSTTYFEVGGVAKAAANPGVPALSSSGAIAGRNYVFYQGLTAAMDGTISGKVWAGDANGASFNGIQLMAVPEPSTLALLATALFTVGCCTWRRRK